MKGNTKEKWPLLAGVKRDEKTVCTKTEKRESNREIYYMMIVATV